MKKKFQLLFFMLLFIISCNTIPKGFRLVNGQLLSIEQPFCSKIFQKVQKKWAKHDKYFCFHYSKSLTAEIIQNKNCFIGLDKAEIIGLLGKPTLEDKWIIAYNLSKSCENGDEFVSPYRLDFYLKEDKVADVKLAKASILE
jgi:hypothetical protein